MNNYRPSIAATSTAASSAATQALHVFQLTREKSQPKRLLFSTGYNNERRFRTAPPMNGRKRSTKETDPASLCLRQIAAVRS